jgi:hypothetical protein
MSPPSQNLILHKICNVNQKPPRKPALLKAFHHSLVYLTPTWYHKGMADKKPKKAWGRPRTTDEIQDLLMARAHFEAGISTRGMGDIFGVTKTQAHNRLTEIRTKYPEFVEFLQGLAEAPTITPGEKLQQLRESEQVRTATEMTEKLATIKQNLANAIEETIAHLLDMTPEELKAMKTEHKLKHIPELVKTMRLLREQSTENIQKLSLVKAVGIATARRSSESRRHSNPDSGVAD